MLSLLDVKAGGGPVGLGGIPRGVVGGGPCGTCGGGPVGCDAS